MQIEHLWNKDSTTTYRRLRENPSFRELLDGHQRFVSDRRNFPNQAVHDLKAAEKGQTPHTAIFTCSDSRVISEVIFDQGIGDLFVIRNAGNVLSTHVLGSLEFAIAILKVRLVVVMGHSDCGAASAAMDSDRIFPSESYLPAIIQAYRRPFEIVRQQGKRDLCNHAIKYHVNDVVEELRNTDALFHTEAPFGKAEVIGAYFSFRTRRVHLLDG